MNPPNFIRNILQDVKVDLAQEFDRNFERKAFFDKPWPATKLRNYRGSLMMRSGKLRRSIKAQISGATITFSSSMPYAAIHNEGGEITVTDKMKRYFWAMYYKASGAVVKGSKSKRNQRISTEADQWKALALMKVGTKMKIDQRQFIGHHPQVDTAIRKIVDHNIQQLASELGNQMRRMGR